MKAHPTVSDLEHAAEMNPNLDVIFGLRELAEFLSDHPELPPVWLAYTHIDDREDTRGRMRLLADALGDEAKEEVVGGDVTITGTFTGNVKIQIRAPIRQLSDAPPVPEYEPIIRPSEPVSLPIDDSDFDA